MGADECRPHTTFPGLICLLFSSTDFAHDAFPNEARLVCFSSGCGPQGGRWWRMWAQAAVAGEAAVLMVAV